MKPADIKLPSNKKFGLFFAIIFFILALYFFYFNNHIVSSSLLFLSLILFITSLLKPNLLLPLNKLWMKLGLFLGMIVNPIVMGILFFGLITPYAIIMRILGRDVLHLKKSNKSHWIPRSTNLPQTDFKKQF